MLLMWFMKLMDDLSNVFPQQRTFERAKRLMLSGVLTVGRHWITRMICTAGREKRDWSADYKVFSRSTWKPTDLFEPVLRRTALLADDKPLVVGLDDTGVPRAGARVKAGRWMRDPLSPPFRVNLIRGLRFLHFSALVRPGFDEGDLCRGIPVRFEMVEMLKRPGKKASDEEVAAYKREKKEKNLSKSAEKAIKELRSAYDGAGFSNKHMIVVADGSYCNRTVMGAAYERTTLLARTRKDAALCMPAVPGSRKVYSDEKFTPEEVLKNKTIPWTTEAFVVSGTTRDLNYKEVTNVRWRRGTRRCPVRLFVLAPISYRLSLHSRKRQRQPGYLLTRDMDTPACRLIQSYIDRWEIEVNHRDLKEVMGLGQAQVWADDSVPRQPAFIAASYSLLLLAAHYAYGTGRGEAYGPLPSWRRSAKRASALDIVSQLRKECISATAELEALGINLGPNALTLKAAG